MDTFDSIFQRAASRKGGVDELEALLPKPKSRRQLARLKDADALAEMTKCIFRAGFVWQVIENKWPGFEVAFAGFDVSQCALLSDEQLEALARDERIVRNPAKIRTIPANARYILDVRESHGSYGKYLAGWPEGDFVGLWDDLKKRGARLGGHTAGFFLRFVGRDTPMFSQDVVKALIEQGVVDKEPTGKGAQRKVQEAFDVWREQSGRSMCEISRVLACSVP